MREGEMPLVLSPFQIPGGIFLLYSFFCLATTVDQRRGAGHMACISFKEVSLEIPISQMKKPRHPQVM